MAREKVWRHRVSPQAAFHEHPQELAAAFLNRVGVLFYGTEWTSVTLESLRTQDAPTMAGSDADLAAVVRDQVIASLRSGRLTAIVWLFAAARPHARLEVFGDGWDELSDVEQAEALARPSDDPLIGENSEPKQRTFTVHADVWRRCEPDISIDWTTSQVTISAEHLRDDSSILRREQPISENYNVQPVVRDVPLLIRYPFSALRDLVTYEELPDEMWFRRYKLYRDDSRLEALAAMWRYLAINGFTASDLPSAADLAKRADEYLAGQGFSNSRAANRTRKRNSGLEEMAGLVRKQFENPSQSGSVLVSGNPRSRRPA